MGEMIKFYRCVLFGLILCSLRHKTRSTTTENPLLTILRKFHQNDYKISYEWSEITRKNQSYGEFYKHTFKYNRTTTAFNLTFLPKVDFGYEIEAIIQMYKFASNEYRLYPIRGEMNLCIAIEQQTMGLNKFARGNGNISCPILKGKCYKIFNWTPEEANFPPLIPTGKYMLEMQLMYRSDEILMSRDYGSIYRPIIY